ncbi:MAG TPA: DUF1990 domain-containing protein [Acidothermaceae bacterium]
MSGRSRDEILGSLARQPFSYREVGATASVLPTGYHQVRRSDLIGHGRDCFEAAADALMTWQMHRRAGLHVDASDERARVDAVVLMRLGPSWSMVRVPCRVVYEVEEGRRRGFAYGTLPGHPESGEESFVVELMPNDDVVLHIIAFSKQARLYARVGGPLSRLVQRFMTDRYVRALRRLAMAD